MKVCLGLLSLCVLQLSGFELYVPPIPVPEDVRSQLSMVMDVDRNMIAVWLENGVVYSSHLPRDGTWAIPSPLSSVLKKSSSPRITIDSSGKTTVIWIEENSIKTATQLPGESWNISKMEPSHLEIYGDARGKSRVSIGLAEAFDESGGALLQMQVEKTKQENRGIENFVRKFKRKEDWTGSEKGTAEFDPALLPEANAIDAPTSSVLSGAQIGFAAGTAAPANGLAVSGQAGFGASSLTANRQIQITPAVSSVGAVGYGLIVTGGTYTATANNDSFYQIRASTSTIATTGSNYTGINFYNIYAANSLVSKSGGGTVATAYGIYSDAFSSLATTQYGLYIAKPSGGTNNYTAYFDGGVGIGVAPSGVFNISANSGLSQYWVDWRGTHSVVSGGSTIGFNYGPTLQPASAATSAFLIDIFPQVNTSSASITTFYSLSLEAGVYTAGGGSVGTAYSLYVRQPGFGTNRYTAYLDQFVGIGSTATVSSFRVTTSGSVVYYGIAFDGTLTQTDNGASNGTQIGFINAATLNPTLGSGSSEGIRIQSSIIAPSTKTIGYGAQLFVNPIYSANVGTINSAYGIRIDTGPTGAGTITDGYGLYVSKPAFGSNQYTAYFDVGVGVGTVSGADKVFNVGGTLTAASGSVRGASNTASIGATSSNTVTAAYSQYIGPNFAGNAGTITTAYGLFISIGASAGTITNAYALYVSNPSYGAATTRYTAYFDTGVGIGTTPFLNNGGIVPLTIGAVSSTNQCLRIQGTAETLDGNGNIAGIVCLPTLKPPSAAVGAYGASIGLACNATNGAITTAYGLNIDAITNAGGTLTNSYGIYVAGPGAGSNAYSAFFQSGVGIGTTPTNIAGLSIHGTMASDRNKVDNCGGTTLRWNTVYTATSTTGTSRLASAKTICKHCNSRMVRPTGAAIILGEEEDYLDAWCSSCGYHTMEAICHLPKERLLDRKPPPKIEFQGFKVNQYSGNSRGIQVLFVYVDEERAKDGQIISRGIHNSTFLSDIEYEQFLTLSKEEQKRFLFDLGLREWNAMEEVRLLEEECERMQKELDTIASEWAGSDLLKQ